MMDTTGAIVVVAPGVAVDSAPDKDIAHRHPAGNSALPHLARHRAKMAVHFAGTAKPDIEEQRMDMASRKAKSRVLNRAVV